MITRRSVLSAVMKMPFLSFLNFIQVLFSNKTFIIDKVKVSGGWVPGTEYDDKIPTVLTPGKLFTNRKSVQQYGPLLARLNTPGPF